MDKPVPVPVETLEVPALEKKMARKTLTTAAAAAKYTWLE